MDLLKLLSFLVVLNIVSVQCQTNNNPEFSSSSRVTLSTNRGYRDLLIAIGEGVPEDANLIEKIKTVFTEFSSFLYQATNVYDSGVFFEEIRILVPESWSDQNDYEDPTWETFSTSDIRVEQVTEGPNRNQPSTNKPTQCGEPGMYIHLTPDYITDDSILSLYGDRARTLTHEWGHFRWGVFDEYPLNDDPHFYAASNGNFEATRCVIGITGVMRTQDGEECVTDSSGAPDENCRFFDDRDSSESYAASLMYKQFLPEMQTFCDDVDHTGGVPSKTHNVEAPNEQNNLCGAKSVWEVLREHSDFPKDTPRNTPNNALPQISTLPSFRVFRRRFQALPTVIVLDRSGSMRTNGRLHTLRQASYNLISRVLEDTQLFGVVNFNTDPEIVRSATTPVGDNRQDSIYALPPVASGGTHIGKAVLAGVSALQTTPGEDVSGSQIILLTDGEENDSSRPKLEDLTIEQLEGVTVHTVAISTDAQDNLEEIANRTNGRTFFQRDNSAALFNIFSRLAIQDSSQIVEILSETFNVTNGTVIRPFSVGPFSTGQMTVLVAFPELEASYIIRVEVIKPDGSIISNGTAQSPDSFQFVGNFSLYQIDTQAEIGQWQIKVTIDTLMEAAMGQTGTMHVETKRSSLTAALPIEANAQWALPEVQPSEIQTLYVTVNRGYTPVANAKVEVEVSLPDNSRVKLPVWDDGIGSDVRAKDGIYTAFFTQFKGTGRYSMQVSVKGQTGVTKLMQGSRVGQGPAAVDPLGGTVQPPEEVNTGEFERIIEGESFRCTDEDKCRDDQDLYGPFRITDLRGIKVTSNKTAVLKFTAPGDDLFRGTAAYYEIYVSTNFTLLMKEPGNATKLDYVPREARTNETEAPYVTSGNLTNPKPARSTEEFEIQLLQEAGNFSYVFCVFAVDDEGHRSQPSNFATVTAKEKIIPEEIPGLNLLVIFGPSLSFLFLLLLLLLLLFLLVKRRKKAQKVHESSHATELKTVEISPSQNPVETDVSPVNGIAKHNNNNRYIQSELQKRLNVNQTVLPPPARSQAVTSSSGNLQRNIHMNGAAYEDGDTRNAYKFVGGNIHTDDNSSAYNFVSPSLVPSENINSAATRSQQDSQGNYPFWQVGSRRDDVKQADKIYMDAPPQPLTRDTYGISNQGFESNEDGRQGVGTLSEFNPPPAGPPPRPRQRYHEHGYPEIPKRDDKDSDSEDSDKNDYEPVVIQNSNNQLTINMLQPAKQAPPLPGKVNGSEDVAKRPLMPPKPLARAVVKPQIPNRDGMHATGYPGYQVGTNSKSGSPMVYPPDSDDDGSYDEPPTDNVLSTTYNDAAPVVPPRDSDEDEEDYDEPPPSNSWSGHDDNDNLQRW